MRRAVALVALVLASGCASVAPPSSPSDTTSDVHVDASSDHGRAAVITVGVAPSGHAGMRVEFADGTVRDYPDATGIDGLPPAAVARAVSIRPVGDDVQSRVYRWPGPQRATATFENVPRNATVTYSVASPEGPEPMHGTGRLTCGPTASLTAVRIRVAADGHLFVGNDCSVPS